MVHHLPLDGLLEELETKKYVRFSNLHHFENLQYIPISKFDSLQNGEVVLKSSEIIQIRPIIDPTLPENCSGTNYYKPDLFEIYFSKTLTHIPRGSIFCPELKKLREKINFEYSVNIPPIHVRDDPNLERNNLALSLEGSYVRFVEMQDPHSVTEAINHIEEWLVEYRNCAPET